MDSDTDLETDFIKTIDKSSARNRQCFNICTDIVNKSLQLLIMITFPHTTMI